MCNFGARSVWSNGRIAVSSYLDVETIKYQYHLIIPTALYCILGYIMEDYFGDWDLKRLPYIRLNLIGGYISSY